MLWCDVLQLAHAHVDGPYGWRAILVEEKSRQRIRIALWAPDDRVRFVAALAWDAGLGAGNRSSAIARARALARDAMKCATAGADLDSIQKVDLGLSWANARTK